MWQGEARAARNVWRTILSTPSALPSTWGAAVGVDDPDVATDLRLDWHTVKAWSSSTCASNSGGRNARPRVIGLDEISLRRGHTYRIVVTDLIAERAIWFGAQIALSEPGCILHLARAAEKQANPGGGDGYVEGGLRASTRHMRRWQASFDKFHVLRHLARPDLVRKSEYARLSGKIVASSRAEVHLLAHRANLSLDGRRALKTLLAANKRSTRRTCQRIVRQLWSYDARAGAALLRELAAALKWQRLTPYERLPG